MFIEKLLNIKLYPEIDTIGFIKNHILNTTKLKIEDFISGNYRLLIKNKLTEIKNSTQTQYLKINKSLYRELSILWNFNHIITFNHNINYYINGFYFSFFLDFRLRLYSVGSFSPTNDKLLRLGINYGNYTQQEINTIENEIINTKCWEIIKKYIKVIDELLNIKISDMRVHEQASVFWLLIELSKPFKSSLIKDGKVSVITFLTKGIEVYNNNICTDNIEDNINIFKATKTIKSILNKNLTEKTIFFKDATASVLQHLLKLLGQKDDTAAKYCNFTDNENWWDPYHYIIKSYLDKNPKCQIKEYMKRKYLKKMIMTFNYSATLYTNVNDTLFEINKSDSFKNLSNEEKKIKEKVIWDELKKFHNYLKDNYEEELFFINKSKTIINSWNEKKENILTHDNSIIPLNYFKHEEKRYNHTIAGKRKTLVYYKTTNEYDSKSTIRALVPNIIHASDSQLSRLLLSKYSILTIHDSFGIDILNICKFIDETNTAMNLKLIKTKFESLKTEYKEIKIYSIFILL